MMAGKGKTCEGARSSVPLDQDTALLGALTLFGDRQNGAASASQPIPRAELKTLLAAF
jgi:hypothetical protein